MAISTPENQTRDLRPIELEFLRGIVHARRRLDEPVSRAELLMVIHNLPVPAQPVSFLQGLAVGLAISVVPSALFVTADLIFF
jgi:hypothetical protein